MEDYDFEHLCASQPRLHDRRVRYVMSFTQLRMWRRSEEERFTIICEAEDWGRARKASVVEIVAPTKEILEVVSLGD
jgi:hypothetical protein